MELLEIAKKLRDKGGLSIIPLPYQSKKAVISWKIYQTRKATDEEFSTWFPVGCKANMAVICGKVSDNLLVLDFDNLDAFKVWNERISMPTLTVNTGKGKHLYYRLTEGNPSNGRFFVDGQHAGEIRFSGGYVVCPPSLHPNGNWYKWERYQLREVKLEWLGICPPPPLASALRKDTKGGGKTNPHRYIDAAISKEMQSLMQTPVGQRHNKLRDAAIKLQKYTNQAKFGEAALTWGEIERSLRSAALTLGDAPNDVKNVNDVLKWAEQHPPVDV